MYVGHVSPNSESVNDIAASILSYFIEQGISLEYLDLVGCDGTNINNRWKVGTIKQLEDHQWTNWAETQWF